MKKKTKILATVGPASDNVEILEGLINAGVNVFRLNFSHGSQEYHHKVLKHIRQAEDNLHKKVGILQDICGPKIRVGELTGDFELKENDRLIFVKKHIKGEKNDGVLSSQKGVNFPNTILNLEIITPKDEEDLKWGAKYGVDFVAVSFVQSEKDIKKVKKLLAKFKSTAQVIAKIEKFDAELSEKQMLPQNLS